MSEDTTDDTTFSLSGLAMKLKQFQKEVKKTGKQSLEKGFKQFFAKYGHLVTEFSWDQYTPYWADGERCEFGYCSFMDYGDHVILSEGIDENDFYGKNASEEAKAARAALKDIDSLLGKNQDILEMIFGDDATVKVTAKGITRHDNTSHE